MQVTKEQVQDKAKELGLNLTDEQVNALVAMGVLPHKPAESDPPPDDDDDDSDDGGKSKGAQKRIKQLLAQLKDAQAKLGESTKVLEEYKKKDEQADLDRKKKEGKVDEILAAIEQRQSALDSKVQGIKERARSAEVSNAIRAALITAGLSPERVEKALRLFPQTDVEFEWTDEDNLVGHVGGEIDVLVAKFKEDNEFLWGGNAAEPPPVGGWSGARPPQPRPVKKEERESRIRQLFSALR